jgi:hypothetical protein
VRGDRLVSGPRRDGAGEGECTRERCGADEDPLAERQHPAGECRPRTRVSAAQSPYDDGDERGTHAELRECRSRRRTSDTPVEPVHEQHLEDHVHEVSGDDDDERSPKVCDAAQVALSAECQERRGEAHRGDAEVRHRVIGCLALAADERDELRRQHRDERRHQDTERQREPDRLRPEPPRSLLRPSPARACDLRSGAVLEEVEDDEEASEDHRRHAEGGELRAAQMADDGRVDEQVQRLGRERAQGGECQRDDLAVVRRPEGHAEAAIVASYAAT